VLKKHEMAFRYDRPLGKHPTKVHINLVPGTKPISSAPYITSPAKRELIDKQLDLWLKQGVIEPSKSPWGAPVLIVHQHSKDHLCVDWRKLNATTMPDQFPIPQQSDILQALSGAQFLSSFDALEGFTQLEFNKVSQPYTAMRTHRSLHQFTRMPFRWRNSPPVFQRVMQEILTPYLWIFTLVYINDIMVYSQTFEEHLEHINRVLDTIWISGITLALHKCHVGYRSIQLLGQKVSHLRLSTNAEKI
jgi:Reverse transcriptase (RNA-dependent DNA polymerase)